MNRLSTLALPALVSIALCACSGTKGHSTTDTGATQAHTTPGALDGRKFDVMLLDQGATKGEADLIEFVGGRFHSRSCDPYGYTPSPYTVKDVSGGMEFHATCTNSAGDRNVWSGTVRGGAIEGKFVWTPVGKSPVERSFRGNAMP